MGAENELQIASSHCRAICGEMHSGFAAMRSALPMNLKGNFPGMKVWSRAQADIDRAHETLRRSHRRLDRSEAALARSRARFDRDDAEVKREIANSGRALEPQEPESSGQ